MSKININPDNIIGKALVGEDFMSIMEDYEERQQDDPNFDPRTQLYDLYDDLVQLYRFSKNNYDG
jgi:hypothetical protein